jgi:hypothetical protein
LELTFNRLLSGEWLKQAQRHNLAKRLVHNRWGINDFVVSSRRTLRIISQDARNVNGGALADNDIYLAIYLVDLIKHPKPIIWPELKKGRNQASKSSRSEVCTTSQPV